MSKYFSKKPRYVRDWYLKLKERFNKIKAKKIKEAERLEAEMAKAE